MGSRYKCYYVFPRVMPALALCITSIILAALHKAAGLYCLEKVNLDDLGEALRYTEYTNITDKVFTAGQAARKCNQTCHSETNCKYFMVNTLDEAGTRFSCQLMGGPMRRRDVSSTMPTLFLSFACVKDENDWQLIGQQYDTSTWPTGAPPAGAGRDWRCMAEQDTNGNKVEDVEFGKITNKTMLQMIQECRRACVERGEGCDALTWSNASWAPNVCYLKKDLEAGADGSTGATYKEVFNGTVGQVTCIDDEAQFARLGRKLAPNLRAMQLEGVYYTLFPEKSTWLAAQKQCKSYGGDLATPKLRHLDLINSTLLQFLPARHQGYRRAYLGYTNRTDPRTGDNRTIVVGQENEQLVVTTDLYVPDLETANNAPKKTVAYTHLYMYSFPDDIANGQSNPGVYLYSVNGSHEQLPFICETSEAIDGAIPADESTLYSAVPSTSKPSVPIWVPIVAAVGGILILAILGFAAWYLWKKLKEKREWNEVIGTASLKPKRKAPNGSMMGLTP